MSGRAGPIRGVVELPDGTRVHEDSTDWMDQIPRKVRQRKRRDRREMIYREEKTAAHTTVGGKGVVARLRAPTTPPPRRAR
jgi:hypothetical protein